MRTSVAVAAAAAVVVAVLALSGAQPADATPCSYYSTCEGCTSDAFCEYCSTLGCMSTSDPSYCSGYFYSVPSSCPNYLYDDDDTGAVGGSVGGVFGFIVLLLLIRWCVIAQRAGRTNVVVVGRRQPNTVVQNTTYVAAPASYTPVAPQAQYQQTPPAYGGAPGYGGAPAQGYGAPQGYVAPSSGYSGVPGGY